jgi:hypothetical protein
MAAGTRTLANDARALQRSHDLAQAEGIASAPLRKTLQHRRGRVFCWLEELRSHLHGRPMRQRAERHAMVLPRALAPRRPRPLEPRVRGDHHPQRQGRLPHSRTLERVEEISRGPLRIVDDHRHRPRAAAAVEGSGHNVRMARRLRRSIGEHAERPIELFHERRWPRCRRLRPQAHHQNVGGESPRHRRHLGRNAGFAEPTVAEHGQEPRAPLSQRGA